MSRRQVLSVGAASVVAMNVGLPRVAAAAPSTSRPATLAAAGVPTSFKVRGTTVAGTLFQPSGSSGRVPIVVMAHGFGLRASDGLAPYQERFVAAGAGVLTFDYRGWGASDGSPRQIIDPWAQLDDLRAAINHVRGVSWVNPDQVVLWGTSFAGGHVLHVRAEDPRLAGVIAQVPHVNGPASASTVPPATTAALLTAAAADAAAGALGLPPVYATITGTGTDIAFITQPGAFEAYQFLTGTAGGWRNQVAARVALQIPLYSPDAVAAQGLVPTFIGIASNDVVTPNAPTRALAGRMGATLHEYTGTHFDAYRGTMFDQLVADEVAFLRTVTEI